MTVPAAEQNVAPSWLYGCKRVVLGKPLITEEIRHERLSNPVAMGAL
jgi:hypothetical protein